MTVPEKRVLVAQIMIFLYRRFSATTPKNGTKLLCLSQRYLPLFAYTHAKFERVEVFLKGQARLGGAKNHGLKNGSTFKVQSLHLSLPVIVQFLHGIIAVTEGGNRVRLDSIT